MWWYSDPTIVEASVDLARRVVQVQMAPPRASVATVRTFLARSACEAPTFLFDPTNPHHVPRFAFLARMLLQLPSKDRARIGFHLSEEELGRGILMKLLFNKNKKSNALNHMLLGKNGSVYHAMSSVLLTLDKEASVDFRKVSTFVANPKQSELAWMAWALAVTQAPDIVSALNVPSLQLLNWGLIA